MRTWNTPELVELNVVMTADGALDWDNEGEIVCETNENCKYSTNRRCIES